MFSKTVELNVTTLVAYAAIAGIATYYFKKEADFYESLAARYEKMYDDRVQLNASLSRLGKILYG